MQAFGKNGKLYTSVQWTRFRPAMRTGTCSLGNIDFE